MMRTQILTTTAMSALLLAACGEQNGAGYEELEPGDQTETETLTQDDATTGNPRMEDESGMETGPGGMDGDAATMNAGMDAEGGANISRFYDAPFLLDYTQDRGAQPIELPDGLSWEAGDESYILSGELPGEPDSSGMTGGAAFEIPTNQAASFAGQSVEVVVVASAESAAGFNVAYSTNEGQDSGWHSFEAGQEPEVFMFEYSVPANETGSGDYIGVVPTGGEAVNIHAIAVRHANG
ncbi:hypothetical protein [Marinicauda sp. Alg238-R41]|uniref:hypothetical protein n=1 Tax=Marinicauda sp. Alg238-R41 TaxID=2993447 RepID=UPI0022E1D0F8|nr:hypothetical protein [Marinicauda sp. Alg238-R41]